MLSKQALGNTLWGMADILRGKVEDYKSYILSLLFFKRLSDNYYWEIENGINKHIEEYGSEPNDIQKQMIIDDAHDFKIPANNFWSDVRQAPQDRKNEKLNDAVNAIANENQNLKGVINPINWNQPAPDGSGRKRLDPQVLTTLVNYLDAVDLSNKNASPDILGDAYEYLIKKFADENKGGTTAGQFYTPQEVVDIIVRYLKPKENDVVYDPTCGSGGFLINCTRYVKDNYGDQKKIRIRGQELTWNTWAIAKVNMILHGIDAKIKQGDTLISPKFTLETDDYKVQNFDLVMANFPFSTENWWQNGTPKLDKKGRPQKKKDGSPQLQYSGKETFSDPYGRLEFGIPPFSNGDFAFIQHIISSINETGKGGVVCPQGVLFRGQPQKTEEEDGQNRKADDEHLIRKAMLGRVEIDGKLVNIGNIIDAIVVLPGNLFYGTTIPGSIIFFNKNKPEERRDKVLMVYGAKDGWFKEESNLNVLLPHDILRISTMLEAWGNKTKAEEWIESQRTRLFNIIQDNLDFKLSEIEIEYKEDIETAYKKIEKAKEKVEKKLINKKKPTKSELNNIEKTEKAYKTLIEKKTKEIETAKENAEKERIAIDELKTELLEMFDDPEKRKRYFSIVDMEEIEENEFNLNIPRYVDTFEPEEEIDLEEAIEEFSSFQQDETSATSELEKLLEEIQQND